MALLTGMRRWEVTLPDATRPIRLEARNAADAARRVGLALNHQQNPVQVTGTTYEIGTVLLHVEEARR
jgi:hypothetical protein